MRIIDADKLPYAMINASDIPKDGYLKVILPKDIKTAKQIDAQPVTRCGICRHREYDGSRSYCLKKKIDVIDTWWCADGDRRK